MYIHRPNYKVVKDLPEVKPITPIHHTNAFDQYLQREKDKNKSLRDYEEQYGKKPQQKKK